MEGPHDLRPKGAPRSLLDRSCTSAALRIAAAATRLLQLLLRLRLRLLRLREHRRFLALLLLLLLLLLAASADQAPRVCAPSQKKKSKMSAESVRKAQGKKA